MVAVAQLPKQINRVTLLDFLYLKRNSCREKSIINPSCSTPFTWPIEFLKTAFTEDWSELSTFNFCINLLNDTMVNAVRNLSIPSCSLSFAWLAILKISQATGSSSSTAPWGWIFCSSWTTTSMRNYPGTAPSAGQNNCSPSQYLKKCSIRSSPCV